VHISRCRAACSVKVCVPAAACAVGTVVSSRKISCRCSGDLPPRQRQAAVTCGWLCMVSCASTLTGRQEFGSPDRTRQQCRRAWRHRVFIARGAHGIARALRQSRNRPCSDTPGLKTPNSTTFGSGGRAACGSGRSASVAREAMALLYREDMLHNGDERQRQVCASPPCSAHAGSSCSPCEASQIGGHASVLPIDQGS